MDLDPDDRAGLNVALNEARWLNIRSNPSGSVDLLFQVLTLLRDGSEPSDSRVVLRLLGAARLAASLRTGSWSDAGAETLPLLPDDLPRAVRSFEGSPIYGWEFVDVPNARDELHGRLSLDMRVGTGVGRHWLTLFQERAGTGFLKLLIEFDDVQIFDATATPILLADFIDGGRRWWDALYQGSPTGQRHGIFPLSPAQEF